MKLPTKLFLALLSFLLLNVASSLSLTFTVPPDTSPFEWILQEPVQLGLFIATGIIVMVLDFYLVFGNVGTSELLPPYTPSTIFGLVSPLIFLSFYFVQRPATPVTFFELSPLTFVTIIFYFIMTLINTIAENVAHVSGSRGKRVKRG
jgi:hypothetical protein